MEGSQNLLSRKPNEEDLLLITKGKQVNTKLSHFFDDACLPSSNGVKNR